MRLRCARSSRIRGTTVDSVANVLQHPILATCRPQDSFSAAAGVGQFRAKTHQRRSWSHGRAAAGAFLSGTGPAVAGSSVSRAASWTSTGCRSSIARRKAFTMSSSDGRSRSTTVSVSVARACLTVDGLFCRARYKGCRLGDWRGCDNEIGKAPCQSSEGENGRSGEAQPHHIERSSLY